MCLKKHFVTYINYVTYAAQDYSSSLSVPQASRKVEHPWLMLRVSQFQKASQCVSHLWGTAGSCGWCNTELEAVCL